MSDERRKAQQMGVAQSLSAVTLPDKTREWRRLVRLRTWLMRGWLGGLACEILTFPLIAIFPFPKVYFLGIMGGLTIIWFGSCCALLALSIRLKQHIEQTFVRKDLANLGCWIDLLFTFTATTGFPNPTTDEFRRLRAQAPDSSRDLYQLLDLIGAFVETCFGSGCALWYFERTSRFKVRTGQSRWKNLLFKSFGSSSQPSRYSKGASKNVHLYTGARACLLEQLPRLSEETAYLLRVDERYALYKCLNGNDAELISVVLRVLPLFGDARALPFVRYLAEGGGLASSNTDVLGEARESLRQLQAVLDLSSGEKGLLRASHPPNAPEEQLLKPAQAGSETDADELLRAENR